jgi:hypothetical protein
VDWTWIGPMRLADAQTGRPYSNRFRESFSWIVFVVDRFRGSFSWIVFVDRFRGSFSWIVFVDRFRGSFSWIVFVDRFRGLDPCGWENDYCRDARSGRPPSGGCPRPEGIPTLADFHSDENGIIPHAGGGRPDRASLQ